MVVGKKPKRWETYYIEEMNKKKKKLQKRRNGLERKALKIWNTSF